MKPLVSSAKKVLRPFIRQHTSFVGSVVELKTAEPQIVLTFDDGPEPSGTEKVLAALADRGATATFFVLLTRVRRYGSLLQEVMSAGHEIGLHGVDHQRLTNMAYAAVHERMKSGRAELEQTIGAPVSWFRPPYGRQTLMTWHAITRNDMTPVLYGPMALDWKDSSISERLTAAHRGAGPGAIVLFHDGLAGPADGAFDGPPPTLDRGRLVGRILDSYAEVGLRGCSLRQGLLAGSAVKAASFKR